MNFDKWWQVIPKIEDDSRDKALAKCGWDAAIHFSAPQDTDAEPCPHCRENELDAKRYKILRERGFPYGPEGHWWYKNGVIYKTVEACIDAAMREGEK